MLTLTKTEFLERIKLPSDLDMHIKVTVDAFNIDNFYIQILNENIPLIKFRYNFHLRDAIEDLIQTGQFDFCGIDNTLLIQDGNVAVTSPVNVLGYIHHEALRETTKETPRHIKLGFMYFPHKNKVRKPIHNNL